MKIKGKLIRISIFTVLLTMLFGTAISYASGSEIEADTLYKKRTEWFPASGNNINVSHYIYHDMNRNGIYDIGDRPLVMFAVKMTRPDGTYIIKRSNLNGFVNFTNSLTATPVDISEPGEYIFEVIVPSGWKITSNNKVQIISYSESKEKRSSLIADRVPTPVGVIQESSISGKIVEKTNGSITMVDPDGIEIVAISPSGIKHTLEIDNNGNFTVEGEYGIWKIEVRDKKTNKLYERKVALNTIPVKMSSIVIGERMVDKKGSFRLVDFENVTHTWVQKMPNGIGGVNWTNLNATSSFDAGGEGYKNNTISGKYVGYSTSGYPVTVYNDEGFDFYGGYFGVGWFNQAEGEILQVKAWRGDELVSEEEFELSALGPLYFDADYRNITKLELKTKHYWQFVVDDILIGVD